MKSLNKGLLTAAGLLQPGGELLSKTLPHLFEYLSCHLQPPAQVLLPLYIFPGRCPESHWLFLSVCFLCS